MRNPFYFELIGGITAAADENGSEHQYNIIYCGGDGSLEKKQRHISFLTHGRVDGLLIYGSLVRDDSLIQILAQTHFPFALIENNLNTINVDKILIDNTGAGFRATEHLIQLGHSKIAYLSSPFHIKAVDDRQTGYEQALHQYAIPVDPSMIIVPDFSCFFDKENKLKSAPERKDFFEITYQCMKKKLSEGFRPDAIFSSGDIMAYGAIKAILEAGLSVPDDISIIGFDDETSYEFGMIYPPITTMQQPLYQAGYLGIKNLIYSIEHPDEEHQTTVLNPELIIRNSCRAKTLSHKE